MILLEVAVVKSQDSRLKINYKYIPVTLVPITRGNGTSSGKSLNLLSSVT